MIILFGTLYPTASTFKLNLWKYDKVGHFLMFGAWTFLFGIVRALKKNRRPSLWIVFVLGSFYGLLIEILQFVVPTNRSPELLDFVADMLGSGFAIIALHFVFKSFFEEK